MKRDTSVAVALGAGVVIYELACDENNLITAVVRRACRRHPFLVRLALVEVALHLTGDLPARYDALAALSVFRLLLRQLRAGPSPYVEPAQATTVITVAPGQLEKMVCLGGGPTPAFRAAIERARKRARS